MNPVRSSQSRKPSQKNTSLYSCERKEPPKWRPPIEDYFSRPNKHWFNDLIGIISPKNGISFSAFQKQNLRPGYMVDTRRFLSKTKRELANGMFEIFGDFSDESASFVRENLMGWIYDNYRENLMGWIYDNYRAV